MNYYSLFWGPEVISTIDEPRGAFTCRSSTLAVFVDSDPFRGLLLIVLVSRRFSWLSNPRVPTLAVLADFCPFRGLLLTVLGSQGDFHGCRTPGCVYMLVINTHNFGQFWSVSWTITHHFQVPKRLPRLINPEVCLSLIHI